MPNDEVRPHRVERVRAMHAQVGDRQALHLRPDTKRNASAPSYTGWVLRPEEGGGRELESWHEGVTRVAK